MILDLRQKQYFKTEASFHDAMKLLQKYLKAGVHKKSHEELEQFFFEQLDLSNDYESNLLERAIDYHNALQIEKGVDPYTTQIAALTEALAKSTADNISVSLTAQSISLEQAFEDFLNNAKVGWSESGGMEQAYRRDNFPILKELVGDLKTHQLTKIHVNELMKVLQNLPSNRSKHRAYRDLSLRDFLSIKVPEEHKFAKLTLKRYLTQFGTFFRWLKSNDYTTIDLDAPLRNIKIKAIRSVDQRPLYTESDIRKLFNSQQYIQGTHKKPSHFWVPLIALYTGARLNEICQLSTSDIIKESTTERWCFDINENKTEDTLKSLKKPFHARLVPIHKKLIELGFIDFHKMQKKHKHKRLFPDLPYVGTANKYGDKLQRWFNRTYQKTSGTSNKGTSFHSLRHTFITHLVNDKQVDPNRIAVGLGQTPTGGVTQTTYTKTASLKDYISLFDKANFDGCYDSHAIRRWDKQLFNQQP